MTSHPDSFVPVTCPQCQCRFSPGGTPTESHEPPAQASQGTITISPDGPAPSR